MMGALKKLFQGLPGPFASIPDLLINGEARRDGGDISYRRPLTNLRDLQAPPAP